MESGSSPGPPHHPRKALESPPFPLGEAFPTGFVFTGQRRNKTWPRGKGKDSLIYPSLELSLGMRTNPRLGSAPGIQQDIPRVLGAD